MTTTADVHQFHGTACLCGFDSHGRSRSMTEHIIEAERERMKPIVDGVYARGRADERERIAKAIDGEHQPAGGFCCFDDHIHRTLILAARIARSGGRDAG